jgi:hypothetical protein
MIDAAGLSPAGAGTPIAIVVVVALLFPVVLLALIFAMDRVEAPLRREAVGEQVAAFLTSARPEDVETFVRVGLARPLERYWRRQMRRGDSLRARLARSG